MLRFAYPGWNEATPDSTRERFKSDLAQHIVRLVNPAAAEFSADMATALGDVLKHKDVRPHVKNALQNAGISAPAASPHNAPEQQKMLIGVDEAIALRYTAGTRQRGEQAYRNTLNAAHATVDATTQRMNDLYSKHCPYVYFPAEGNPGLAVHGPKTLEKMLANDFYWDMMDFSGKRAGKYLHCLSNDGTQSGEYCTDSCMILGWNTLNTRTDTGLHGTSCQSVRMYVPNAIIPMTESKVALDAAYSHPVSLWDVKDLKIKAPGRPELEYHGFCVADDSATSKADKCTGTSSEWFCSFCTLTRKAYRTGACAHKPDTYVNDRVDTDALVLVPIVEDGKIVALEHERRAIRFPVKDRVFLDPRCKHQWHLHQCTCKSVLGKVVAERFDYTSKAKLEACELDLVIVFEEMEAARAAMPKNKKDKKKRQDKINQLEAMVAKMEQSKKEFERRITQCDEHKYFSPKHPDHVEILRWCKQYTFGQTGEVIHKNGTAMVIDDPFHLFFNAFKKQDLEILKSAYRAHNCYQDLQFWFFSVGLRHIDLGNHSEDWDEWIKSSPNRDNLKKPQEARADLNGMECKDVYVHYNDACEYLLTIATDKSLAAKTRSCMVQIHELMKPLFRHLKSTHNFLPRVDGELQNPATDYTNSVKAYHDFFTDNVNASNGFDVVGVDLLMQPWHVMLEHVPGWINKLWNDYDLMIGELSCEIVEHYNKLICRHLERRTNMHESLNNVKENKYFQTLRHFLVQIMCFPHTLFPKKRKSKCSRCREPGHYKNNKKRCTKHEDYKILYKDVYDETHDDWE